MEEELFYLKKQQNIILENLEKEKEKNEKIKNLVFQMKSILSPEENSEGLFLSNYLYIFKIIDKQDFMRKLLEEKEKHAQTLQLLNELQEKNLNNQDYIEKYFYIQRENFFIFVINRLNNRIKELLQSYSSSQVINILFIYFKLFDQKLLEEEREIKKKIQENLNILEKENIELKTKQVNYIYIFFFNLKIEVTLNEENDKIVHITSPNLPTKNLNKIG